MPKHSKRSQLCRGVYVRRADSVTTDTDCSTVLPIHGLPRGGQRGTCKGVKLAHIQSEFGDGYARHKKILLRRDGHQCHGHIGLFAGINLYITKRK